MRSVVLQNRELESIKSLKGILDKVPPPKEPEDNILRALVFDSHYDTYRGVMVYLRIISGEIKKGSLIQMMATNKNFEVLEVGVFTPKNGRWISYALVKWVT